MNLEWMAIRGSGLVAFALLAAATIWGLLVSTKALGPMRAKQVTFFHESLSIGALLATGVHMWALYNDDYITFTLRDLFVPGASAWRPNAVAFGVIGFYALAIITVSFYAKKLIGQKVWRALHFGAFGTFVIAMLHGILAGADSSNPFVFGLYVASGAIVVALLVVRFAQASTPERSSARPARTRETAPRATQPTPPGGRPISERIRAERSKTTG